MKFSFTIATGTRLRDWSRSIAALSRVSDYIQIEIRRDAVVLNALNNTKSAFASVEFDAQEFLDSYMVWKENGEQENSDQRREETDQSAPVGAIKLFTKLFVTIFRRHEKDGTIEKCEISLDESLPEYRLVVRMVCYYGITKVYNLVYERTRPFKVLHSVNDYPNSFSVHSRLLKDLLEHTSARAEELCMKFQVDDHVVLSSFTEGVMLQREILKQPLQTSIVVPAADFEDILIAFDENNTNRQSEDSEDGSVSIVLPLREFRVLISLAESLHAVLVGAFPACPSTSAQPIVLEFKNDIVRTKFLLFT
ncbi:Rad9/Ddc1, partial [Dipodascopsis uninucleata]